MSAFIDREYKSLRDFFNNGFNPEFWTHGLTFNQGNNMNLSDFHARERLKYIARQVLRNVFGNKWREKGTIHFALFQHGKRDLGTQHSHAVMAIEGSHTSSHQEIASFIKDADGKLIKKNRILKPVHIDFDWEKGNRFHSYIARYAGYENEKEWDILKF